MSSKRRQRARRCRHHPHSYPTLAEALAACRELRQKRPEERWNAFRCRGGCGQFHVGRLPQWVARRIDERRAG